MDNTDAAHAWEWCGACGGPLTPIVYGFPPQELIEASERGEVVLGGCVVVDGAPRRRCDRCATGADPKLAGELTTKKPATERKARKRVKKLLNQDLGDRVAKSGRGSWTTISALPHEIRVDSVAGRYFVRVSAGMVIGAKPDAEFWETLNWLNVERPLTRRILIDGKVLVVAEQSVDSLGTGDLESLVSTVFVLARLDAPLLASHGGMLLTSPPPSAPLDMGTVVESWDELLRASGTATEAELVAWLDDLSDEDCWLDRQWEGEIVVVVGTFGTGLDYPFTLQDFVDAADREDDLDGDEEL